jgi:hypothetical protein
MNEDNGSKLSGFSQVLRDYCDGLPLEKRARYLEIMRDSLTLRERTTLCHVEKGKVGAEEVERVGGEEERKKEGRSTDLPS